MPEPDLSQFRAQVERSNKDFRDVIVPSSNVDHTRGMTNEERRRVVADAASQIRGAMDGA